MCLALPGRVDDAFLEEGLRMARVDFGGVRKRVCLELVPEAGPGDWVLVHVGFAMSRIDEDEALKTLELLGEMDAELRAMNGESRNIR